MLIVNLYVLPVRKCVLYCFLLNNEAFVATIAWKSDSITKQRALQDYTKIYPSMCYNLWKTSDLIVLTLLGCMEIDTN